jgi:hypothetical protein
MRARYLGDHSEFSAWGIQFPRGVFVKIDDPHAQKKISANSHFEVENSDAEEVEFVEVPRSTLAGANPAEDAPAVETATYEDETAATGLAPLPEQSPDEQENAEQSQERQKRPYNRKK